MTKKRSVINWTEDQFNRLAKAADELGLSVPAYVKVKALEAVMTK